MANNNTIVELEKLSFDVLGNFVVLQLSSEYNINYLMNIRLALRQGIEDLFERLGYEGAEINKNQRYLNLEVKDYKRMAYFNDDNQEIFNYHSDAFDQPELFHISLTNKNESIGNIPIKKCIRRLKLTSELLIDKNIKFKDLRNNFKIFGGKLF